MCVCVCVSVYVTYWGPCWVLMLKILTSERVMRRVRWRLTLGSTVCNEWKSILCPNKDSCATSVCLVLCVSHVMRTGFVVGSLHHFLLPLVLCGCYDEISRAVLISEQWPNIFCILF